MKIAIFLSLKIMIDSGPSIAELGITIEPAKTVVSKPPTEKGAEAVSGVKPTSDEDARGALERIAGQERQTETISPAELLPSVDSQAELERLKIVIGQSGENELQRSNFYRIKPQIDILRSHLSGLPKGASLNILNIGPANAEEATVFGVLARNAGVLDRTQINYVDLATRDMVSPEFSLGANFMGQPIEPPPVDRNGYVLENGRWQANADVQQFVTNSLDGADNSFGRTVEDFCRTNDARRYGVVTFNNVAQYLGRGTATYDNPIYQSEGDFTQFQAVLLSVAERVEDGGLLLMQTTGGASAKKINTGAVDSYLRDGTNFDDIFETVDKKAGVYKRKSEEPLIMIKTNDQEMSAESGH